MELIAVYSELTLCVVDGKRRLVTYKEWDSLLQESFEKCYYVPISKFISLSFDCDA